MNTSSYVSKFTEKILAVIQENHLIEPGEGVVAGVSGGPDSVCLLHVLHSLKDRLKIKLYAVHINHMLRGSEADADEEYTAALCESLGIPLKTVRKDIAKVAASTGSSLEEAGREIRYDEFRKAASAVGASKIAVAHNRNDQAETVMMHIIRGTGTAGLSGMEYMRGDIIRPLLETGRDEIDRYCLEAGLSPRTDSSNLEQDFTRNKVRLGLFAYINEKFGVNIVDSLCRLSQNASVDERFLERCAHEGFEKAIRERKAHLVCLDIGQLRELDTAVRVRVLKAAVADVSGSPKGVGSVHYKALLELIDKGTTGAMAELPDGIRASVSYDLIRIFSSKALKAENQIDEEFSVQLAIPGVAFVPALGAEITATVIMPESIDKCGTVGYNPNVQYFDYDKLKQGIYIRNRRTGDMFRPLRSNGTKKLKEFFIDEKIPREDRGRIPLIAVGNEIVWIVGHKISDKFKVTENTKSVLKIEYNRRGHNDSRH
jgi:tRNA(Ile)-lysidine synthase